MGHQGIDKIWGFEGQFSNHLPLWATSSENTRLEVVRNHFRFHEVKKDTKFVKGKLKLPCPPPSKKRTSTVYGSFQMHQIFLFPREEYFLGGGDEILSWVHVYCPLPALSRKRTDSQIIENIAVFRVKKTHLSELSEYVPICIFYHLAFIFSPDPSLSKQIIPERPRS